MNVPLRRIAPATPSPSFSCSFAALTIMSTACSVISPQQIFNMCLSDRRNLYKITGGSILKAACFELSVSSTMSIFTLKSQNNRTQRWHKFVIEATNHKCTLFRLTGISSYFMFEIPLVISLRFPMSTTMTWVMNTLLTSYCASKVPKNFFPWSSSKNFRIPGWSIS